jgi:hypothetical protein
MDPKVFELTFKHELFQESLEEDKSSLDKMKRRMEMCSNVNNVLSQSEITLMIETINAIQKNMDYRLKLIEPLVDYIQEKEFNYWFNDSTSIN